MKFHAGLLCRVIGGVDGLNIGKIVVVQSLQGEHSKLGRIWRATGHECSLITEYGGIGISADFAEDWLKPIPPITAKPQQMKIAA